MTWRRSEAMALLREVADLDPVQRCGALPQLVGVLFRGLAPPAGVVVELVVLERVVLPLEMTTVGALERLLGSPDEGGVLVLGEPLGLAVADYPPVENAEGDSPLGGVVEPGPELGVVSVPVPKIGRIDAFWLTAQAASNSLDASASLSSSHSFAAPSTVKSWE